jgi:hypothetical protein
MGRRPETADRRFLTGGECDLVTLMLSRWGFTTHSGENEEHASASDWKDGGREGIRTLGLLVANEEIYLTRRGAATTYAFPGPSKMGNLGNSVRNDFISCGGNRQDKGKGSHDIQCDRERKDLGDGLENNGKTTRSIT